MYIVAIGWLYVVTLMAFTEANWVAGLLTWVFYGLFPVSLLLWLTGAFARRSSRRAERRPPETTGTPEDRAVADDGHSGTSRSNGSG